MKKVIGILLLVLCGALAGAQTTSNASLKGNYAFQVSGTRIDWGYMDNNGAWQSLSGGGTCPKNTVCQNLTFLHLTAGVLKMNGNGTGSFVSVQSYCPAGSGSGPVAGTTFTYKVSGFTANMSVGGTTVAMSLGNFNGNLAQTAQILIASDSDGPQTGSAILQ